MSEVGKTSHILTQAEFEKSPELKAQYGSYENFIATQLKTQSTFTFAKNNQNYKFNPAETFFNLRKEAYDKHNRKSQELIANYKELEAQYKALLEQQGSVNKALYSKYGVSSNNDLLTAMNEHNSFYDQGVYNRSAKSVNEAYRAFISALQTANYQTHRIV